MESDAVHECMLPRCITPPHFKGCLVHGMSVAGSGFLRLRIVSGIQLDVHQLGCRASASAHFSCPAGRPRQQHSASSSFALWFFCKLYLWRPQFRRGYDIHAAMELGKISGLAGVRCHLCEGSYLLAGDAMIGATFSWHRNSLGLSLFSSVLFNRNNHEGIECLRSHTINCCWLEGGASCGWLQHCHAGCSEPRT